MSVQINQAVGVVKRLLPGELGPSLDFEEQSWNDKDIGHENKINPWSPKQWVDAIQKYFDGVETALGRRPMIYTSQSVWQEAINDSNHVFQPDEDQTAPDTNLMHNYPLWVKMYFDPSLSRYSSRLTDVPTRLRPLPTPWDDWIIWQYSDVKPGSLTDLETKTDMDVLNGTIYQLRGLADLGHTAPHIVGNQKFIVYTQPDGSIHLLEFTTGSWHDENLSSKISNAPEAVGDPAGIGIGNEQIILYRAADQNIYALTRSLTNTATNWSLSPAASHVLDDPYVIAVQNNVHAVYWNENNEQIHLFRAADGNWQTEVPGDPILITPLENASGSGVIYQYQGRLHFISRADTDGHLHDIFFADHQKPYEDFKTSQDRNGNPPPPATYRPTTYTPTGQAPRLVYRAVRGAIWQIERDSLTATDLKSAASAPLSAGSPSAVFSDAAHILYRTLDNNIQEIFNDGSTWKTRLVCSDAAADPTAYIDEMGRVAVSFLTKSGMVRVASLVNGTWQCEDTNNITSSVDDSSGLLTV